MSSISTRQAGGKQRWTARTAAVIALAGTFTSVAVGVSAAQTAPVTARKAVVVKIATRHHFGKILTTVHGRSLYILPMGTCTGQCLGIWPPLLMPRGTRVPRGTHCLGTVRFGHRLQVTYRKKRLYLFTGDSGHSVNGNNVGGFKVAKLVARSCPR